MSNMVEVRWHSRGGQGGVTASKVLGETAMGLGKHGSQTLCASVGSGVAIR